MLKTTSTVHKNGSVDHTRTYAHICMWDESLIKTFHLFLAIGLFINDNALGEQSFLGGPSTTIFF